MKTSRLFSLFLLLALILGACADPYKLSDEAKIKKFTVIEASPSTVAFNESLRQDSIIYLQMTKGRYDFPIGVMVEIETGGPGQRVLNLDLTKPIEFKSMKDKKEFYITGESGLPKKYILQITKVPTSDDNDVEDFKCGTLVDPSDVVLIDQGTITSTATEGNVAVTVEKGSYPMAFTPTVQISLRAKASIEFPHKFTFDSSTDTVSFTITSESGISKLWKVYLQDNAPQLPNNDFNDWYTNSESGKQDPVGWATANNFIVVGTTKDTDPTYGVVPKMTTTKVNGIVKQMAAGSLFLGRFKLDIGQMNNPPLMTYQGIPFTGRPVGISMDMKYARGPQLEKCENNTFVKIDGKDYGKVTVELLYYDGPPNKYEYHGFENTPNIKVVARYQERIDNTGDKWVKRNYSLTPYVLTHQPNYLNVIFSSSAEGDSFIGAVGSSLWVDNILLNYPAEN